MTPERFSEFEEVLLREICEVKAELKGLRELVASELYGANGRLGLKQQVAVLWEHREAGKTLRNAAVGAFLTALASLLVTLVKWVLGA